ncbi:MAG: DUF4115 domain-containing protein, partial [Gammaproteobacteria bacterium]|nr:DUF4115 domain-containing protein [Gammaproteobacteria bacterium]
SGMQLAELTQQHPGWVLGGSVVAVLVAVLLALWFVWPDESVVAEDMDIQAPVLEPDDRMDARMVPASVLAIAETDRPTQDTEGVADPVSPVPEAREPEAREQGYVSQGASTEATSAGANSGRAGIRVGDEAVTRRPAQPDHVLLFSFSDDCWVEVKDSSGRSIYSDLNRSGQVLELAGEAPFRILLGYAPGVRLEYDGEPVALTPHTRNNVAQLVLGQ